ncbi:MAG: hypothetical protein ABR518_06195 [Actinomycetota bacterium]
MNRPLHVLTAAGAVAHHGFELAAGVGLVLQPRLGMAGAAALWGATLPGWAWLAARSPRGWDRVLSFLAGMSAAAGIVHYAMWPVRVEHGLPVLREAEGLRPCHMPAYNAVLYSWTAAAIAALATETPRGTRGWAVPGLVVPFVLRTEIRHHFDWVREQATTNPAWWNRALRAPRAA